MRYLKYLLFGFVSVLLNGVLLALFTGNNLFMGTLFFLFVPYFWLPAIMINAGLICWKNKE